MELSDDIVNTVIRELSSHIPYSDINRLYTYLETICTSYICNLIVRFNIYTMSTKDINDMLGSNMFIIVLPLEGHVFVTSLDIVSKISGLSLWLTNESLRQKILQFTIYNYDLTREPITSPRIIVTDLPSESLTLTKLENDKNNNNTNEITTIHELLMRST